MRKKTLISAICIVFLFFFSFAGKQYGSRMQAAIDAAYMIQAGYPPWWPMP